MKAFNLSPQKWGELSRTDKKTLYYHRVMENHYEDMAVHKAKQKNQNKVSYPGLSRWQQT